MVIRGEISVILVVKSLCYLDGHACPTSIISFSLWNLFQCITIGRCGIRGNENLWTKKLFCDQSFITGNYMKLLMKFYTINHSHYHYLISLIKRADRVLGNFFRGNKREELILFVISQRNYPNPRFIDSKISYNLQTIM